MGEHCSSLCNRYRSGRTGNTEETRYVPAYTASPHERRGAPRMIPPLTDARAWGMLQNDAARRLRRCFGEEVQRPLAEPRARAPLGARAHWDFDP